MVSFTLQEAGYSVIEAGDGKEAQDKLKSASVDLVITDLNMPNVDGIELIKSVRADAKHKFIPIIMLTTESQESKKKEGKDAGATGWIVKPFKPEQLLSVIKKVLG
jgi:two-component system chemotaxis response regulator CheY